MDLKGCIRDKAFKSRVITFSFFFSLSWGLREQGKPWGLRKVLGGEVRRRLTRMAVIRL